MNDIKVFGGRANPKLALEVCRYIGMPMGQISIGDFPDGEIFCTIDEDVRGRDVFLIQPTCPPVNNNLMELLIMIESFKRASAARITAVIPYFGYARQDRKDKGRVPITAKLVANIITRAGADRVLTMDLHADQIQGFFDIPVDHLYASPVFRTYFQGLKMTGDDIVVVSPDEGSIKRALKHVESLGAQFAIVDKRRSSAEKTEQANLIGGPIDGKIAILFDDMISTAGSICGAAEMVARAGAKEIHLAATHGIFSGDAIKRIEDSPVKSVVVTDTVPLSPEKQSSKIKVLPISSLLGEAIKRIHHDESVSYLFNDPRHISTR